MVCGLIFKKKIVASIFPWIALYLLLKIHYYVAINLKFKHMTSRKEESSNRDSVSINRNEMAYHSHNTKFFQTRLSKLNFPNFGDVNPSGWIYKCDRFLKLMELEIIRR